MNSNLMSLRIPGTAIGNGSEYYISTNNNLKDVDVSKITKIDGVLSMVAVPAIDTLQFQNLQDLSGTVRLSGNFSNITMPALSNIAGQLQINSTKSIDGFCHELTSMRSSDGQYTCSSFSTEQRSQVLDTETAQTSESADLTYRSHPTNSLLISTTPLIACIIFLAVVTCVYKRRPRNRKLNNLGAKALEAKEKKCSFVELAELCSPSETLELGTGKEAQEMNGRGLLECGGESVKECGGESVKELDANGWNAVRGSLYSVGCRGRRYSV
jgi:hypothetical protein